MQTKLWLDDPYGSFGEASFTERFRKGKRPLRAYRGRFAAQFPFEGHWNFNDGKSWRSATRNSIVNKLSGGLAARNSAVLDIGSGTNSINGELSCSRATLGLTRSKTRNGRTAVAICVPVAVPTSLERTVPFCLPCLHYEQALCMHRYDQKWLTAKRVDQTFSRHLLAGTTCGR